MAADRLAFRGTDLLGLSEKEMRAVRGRRIAMVMQDPKYSLNPVMRIDRQLGEALRAHGRISSTERGAA